MRTCPSCCRENADSARFCVSCGTPLVVVCAECAAEIPPDAVFCPACGASVGARTVVAGEERKVVTVLFADLVDSTSHAERLDPEDVRGLLSPYFARVRAEVERFGGTVEKFIGDAVMALFGAPAAHEDDPERAVRAALSVRDAVGELNESSHVDLHVRIAVNTGEAVVALGASADTGEGMVAGDVVNTCARLETAAPVDGILVGETTYHATAEAIAYREVGPVEAKGKREPVAAWEAVGLREDAARPAPPLVGRWQELSQLLDALVRVREERTPQLVSLVGVPGIGKTRLARELVTAVEAESETATWLRGRCLPYGDGISFAALAEMARSQAGILTTDSAEEAAAKLRATIEELPGETDAGWLETHLRPLVGLERETAERGEDSFAAWRRFFEALAERRPLMLVFEDLHWADPGVLDFIDHLVDWASGVPLLVLCTARPELLERRPGWGGGKRNAITISLSPLSNDETGELVSALLGAAELPETVAEPLLAQAGGNPLYAEEYTRMLVERGFLVRENGSWRLAAAELPLPESVQGTIAARIDGLVPDEKLLLQQAAVVGKVFWLGAVAEASKLEREQAEQLLHALERKEFIRRDRRTSVAGEVEYFFRHVLVRDVAYVQIPRRLRADAHLQAAEWLEALQGTREDRSELLAHHYECALELARAAGQETADLVRRARVALREAADQALALNAFPAAARFYARALELCPADDPERASILFGYGKALLRAEYGGTEILTEARDALRAAGDSECAAEAEVMLGELTWMHGNTESAFSHFQAAVEELEEAPPSQAKAYVLSSLSRFQMAAGKQEEAIRVGLEALRMAEQLGLEELRAHALDNIGVARTAAGDLAGVGDLERSIEIAEAINSPEAVRGYLNLGSTVAHLGELKRAFDLHAKARATAERFGDAGGIRWLEAESAYEHYWTGRWEQALKSAEGLIADAAAGGPRRMEFDGNLVRGWIRLARGTLDGALEDADAVFAFGAATLDPQSYFPALAFRARALAAVGRRDDAFGQAAELLRTWHTSDLALASFWTTDLAFGLAALGKGDQLRPPEATPRTRWLEAALAVASGDFAEAAELYSEIGTEVDAACARVQAAEKLLAEGREAQAEAQLKPALELFRSLEATAYLRQAEAVLA